MSIDGDAFLRDQQMPPSSPPAGLYHACWPNEATCLDELAEMKAGGFTYTINYSIFDYDLPTIKLYSDKLESLGMKTFWDLSRPTFETVSAQYIIDRVNAVKASSATAGYYVGDEENVTPERVEWIAATVKGADPDPQHLTLFIHYYQIMDCMVMARKYASPSIDVLGLDLYAVANGRPLDDVAICSQAGQQYVTSIGKKWAVVLQAYSGSMFGSSGDYPSLSELYWMKKHALDNSQPIVVFWWWYPDTKALGRWNDLVQVATGNGQP